MEREFGKGRMIGREDCSGQNGKENGWRKGQEWEGL